MKPVDIVVLVGYVGAILAVAYDTGTVAGIATGFALGMAVMYRDMNGRDE